jgi:hypothetical protein
MQGVWPMGRDVAQVVTQGDGLLYYLLGTGPGEAISVKCTALGGEWGDALIGASSQ